MRDQGRHVDRCIRPACLFDTPVPLIHNPAMQLPERPPRRDLAGPTDRTPNQGRAGPRVHRRRPRLARIVPTLGKRGNRLRHRQPQRHRGRWQDHRGARRRVGPHSCVRAHRISGHCLVPLLHDRKLHQHGPPPDRDRRCQASAGATVKDQPELHQASSDAGASSITRNRTGRRALGRNRTCGPRFRKPLLSPLSYEGMVRV